MQINTLRLRKLLGWAGMLLPLIVLALCLIFGYGFPDSISSTYYLAPTVTPFMIILGAAGVLLISYKGYDKHDDITCTLAGLFALCICLFPCATEDLIVHWPALNLPTVVGTFQLPENISSIVHNISAVVFFGLLAYNSFFLFTKSSGEMTSKKRKRNIIYRVCGIGMIASFVFIVPVSIFEIWGGIWLIEAVALAFFGISWLTKADTYTWLFCDTPDKEEPTDNA